MLDVVSPKRVETYLCSIRYLGVAVIYWAPRSAVHLGFVELLLVDILPPHPLALSQTERLTGFFWFSVKNDEVRALVKPPPTTIERNTFLSFKLAQQR